MNINFKFQTSKNDKCVCTVYGIDNWYSENVVEI